MYNFFLFLGLLAFAALIGNLELADELEERQRARIEKNEPTAQDVYRAWVKDRGGKIYE